MYIGDDDDDSKNDNPSKTGSPKDEEKSRFQLNIYIKMTPKYTHHNPYTRSPKDGK